MLEEAKRRAIKYATELTIRQRWVLADKSSEEWEKLTKQEQDYYYKIGVLEGRIEELTQRTGRLGSK